MNNEFDLGEALIKIEDKQFSPISLEELIKILGLTIKKDEENKLITFLGILSAYTENSQLNISFNAPSSTGKSYIPTEIVRLFPYEDTIQVGYCSPTAFFHDIGKYVKDISGYIVNLERKILIFLDQPHSLLLQHLRPLLSHDKKEIHLKITDKTQRAGLRTKNIFIRGFPSVVFCTAGLKIDEQEATRFLLLSPETTQEKIREAIYEKVKKETNSSDYGNCIDNNPERKLLKERIKAIREEGIREIKVKNSEKVIERFLNGKTILKPRHQRDIGRIISLIKVFALVNLWFRDRDGSVITANEADIEEAFKVWEKISESQEYNLPPYIYNLFQEVILPAYREKEAGLTRKDIMQQHYQIYGRILQDWLLRQQIIPMLENSGLIIQEPDKEDRRKILIYPTMLLTISTTERYSERGGGVTTKEAEISLPYHATHYISEGQKKIVLEGER